MHQPMQGAHAQRVPEEGKNLDLGWHLPMTRSASKAHFFLNGRSLCGRHTLRVKVALYDKLPLGGHSCEVCMKRLDKMS